VRPYVICGRPWRHWVGGYRALHYLCDALNRAGCRAYIAHDETSGYLQTLSIAEMEISGLGDFVAVYPERVEGNPYGAPTVVRWLLHRPGAHGEPKAFTDGELMYAWSELIRPEGVGLLWVPTVEAELFDTQRQYEREGACYYVGKGAGDTLGLGKTDAINLSRENVPTREELAGILKRSELFYCYDNYTLLLWEAGMCGCPAVLVPSGEFTREQFKASEYGLEGIAWGAEEGEIARARATVMARYNLYLRMRARSLHRLIPEFIERTQNA